MASDAIQGVSTLQSSYMQSKALRAQGEYQEAIAEMNAKQMELQAEDSVKRGGSAAAKRQQEIRKATGSQRAALAAAGVDVGSDMAQNIAQETEAIGAADIAAIQTNAFREAWGYKAQASDTRSKGRMQKNANFFQARQTMITGTLQASAHFAKAAEKAATAGGGGA